MGRPLTVHVGEACGGYLLDIGMTESSVHVGEAWEGFLDKCGDATGPYPCPCWAGVRQGYRWGKLGRVLL